MPRLSRAQELARQQIARVAERGLFPDELGRRLIQILEQVIPTDGQMLFGVDPGSLLFNRLLAASPPDPPEPSTDMQLCPSAGSAGQNAFADYLYARRWLQHAYLVRDTDPELSFPGLMRAGLTVTVAHDRPETCWGLTRHLLASVSSSTWYQNYHTTAKPLGGGMRVCFAAGGQWVAALQMSCLDPARSFRPSDVEFMRQLAPQIGQALGAAFQRERIILSNETASPDAPGILVLSPHGHVLFRTPAAAAWIRLLWDDGQQGESDWMRLPTAVWSAMAHLRAGSKRHSHSWVRVQSPVGRLRIEACPAADDDAIAILFAPEHPPAPPEIPDSWPITHQERRVLTLLTRGYSNRQIAETLVVSEHTVESHLTHAYDKLGVHSRSQFLARLFSEIC